MNRSFYIILMILLLSTSVFCQNPKVVILGVQHSSQLINANHQPAAIRAFIERVNPSAICIELSPEEYLRNDYYEFTYEQQYVIVPFSRQQKIPIYPIDWLPNKDDLKLAFGIDNLEVPSFTRNSSGFWGFVVYPNTNNFQQDLYFADDEEYAEENEKWYATYPDQVNSDFARRLFLYRTFLQAKRIQATLRNYTEKDTVLVVIGALHKKDIEKILQGNGYTVIQPNAFGELTAEEIDKNFERKDAYAILNFNLLGMQSYNNTFNRALVDYAFKKIEEDENSEKDFFNIRYDILKGNIDSESAIVQYKKLLETQDTDVRFTWDGVKNQQRIDSYFDPFGNLTLGQRILLEIAREYLNHSENDLFEQTRVSFINEFSGFKKSMLVAYFDKYLKE